MNSENRRQEVERVDESEIFPNQNVSVDIRFYTNPVLY